MDEVTYVKTKLRQEQWEKLIAECQSSGLKVDDWCLKNNVSRHAYYYYWLRKIRKKACESLLPAIAKQDTQIAFTKVEMQVQQTSSMVPIIIRLQSATLEIYPETDQQMIEVVLRALKNIC